MSTGLANSSNKVSTRLTASSSKVRSSKAKAKATSVTLSRKSLAVQHAQALPLKKVAAKKVKLLATAKLDAKGYTEAQLGFMNYNGQSLQVDGVTYNTPFIVMPAEVYTGEVAAETAIAIQDYNMAINRAIQVENGSRGPSATSYVPICSARDGTVWQGAPTTLDEIVAMSMKDWADYFTFMGVCPHAFELTTRRANIVFFLSTMGIEVEASF
ncbi:hypothetical protein TWF694_008347 [Orbilia ellipsospora]|uniref:Capsid protein n=1 Tax=Orbilia ellipsospora TaxID=2528407 RepID=A0AAV9WUQ9_9PEZI